MISIGAKEALLTARETAERLFSRKALLLSGAMVSAFMFSATTWASFEYISHQGTYNPSVGGTVFNGPTDIAFLKSNGNMVIVDSNAGVTGGGEVVIQQTDGTFVTKVAALDDQGPVRAAVDPNSGDVYIGTYYESKIRRYTEAGGVLTLADTWTGCTANGGNGPYSWGKTFGVAVDSHGEIYVGDYDNLRIVKMNTAGQCTAAALTTYTKNGTAGQIFLNLTGLAVDSADNLWVADYGKKVIVKYDSAGVWQTTLTGFANCGTTTAFGFPRDIDIDPVTNDLFVSDSTYGVIKLDSSGNFLTKKITYNGATSLSVLFGSGYTTGYLWATDYGHSSVVKYQNPSRKVSVTASANGTVAADVGGLITGTTGGNTCVDQFVDATTVVLTATPASGYTTTWGGADGAACTGDTCTLTNIAADQVVTATFTAPAPAADPGPVTPPPITTIPTGGGSTTLNGSGTATITVTDNGSTGTVVNLDGAGTNSFALPGTGTVSVANTGTGTLTVTTIGDGQTVLNNSTGTVTVMSTVANQPIATTGNGTILVTANTTGASATLTNNGGTPPNVNTGGNTTVTILGTPEQVSGATLQLSGSTSGGGDGAPVSFQSSPTANPVTMTPSADGANFTLQPVLQSDGSTVSALVITSGSVTITVASAGNTGIAAGNAPVTAGNDSTTLTVTASAGQQILFVGNGFVVLPAPTQTRASSQILADNKIHAGESVILDAAGNVTAAWIGSQTRDQGLTGDPTALPAIAGLTIKARPPKLTGTSPRLGADLETTALAQLRQLNLATGISGNGESIPYQGMAVGSVTIDDRQADGHALTGNGQVTVTQRGVAVTFVPASSNLTALAGFIQTIGGEARLNADGSFLLKFGNHYYALQPGYAITRTDVPTGQGRDAVGNVTYTDPEGLQQTLYPALADFATLEAAVKKLDAAAVLTGNADGTLTLVFKGKTFVLRPDYAVTFRQGSHIGEMWWLGADGKIYVRLMNALPNYVQGLTVE